MRVVIDTNVLISAIFWTGAPKRLLNKARRREMVFITSQTLLGELEEILLREDKPFRLSPEEAKRILKEIKKIGEVIPTHTRVQACEHEPDNRVLECAVDGTAQFIITGDKHFLRLKSFRNIKIVSVLDFLTRFGTSKDK